MFFIGLAGSLMPYLLFLGVLFVLTLGANTNPDTKVADSEKTIEYENPVNAAKNPVKDSYFYNTEENRHICQSQSNCTFPEDSENKTCKRQGKTRLCFIHQRYHHEVYHTFFGLSPPALIS